MARDESIWVGRIDRRRVLGGLAAGALSVPLVGAHGVFAPDASPDVGRSSGTIGKPAAADYDRPVIVIQ